MVTQGGDSVKLGLVPVYLLNSKEIKAHCETTRMRLQGEVAAVDVELLAATQHLEQCNLDVLAAKQAAEEAENEVKRAVGGRDRVWKREIVGFPDEVGPLTQEEFFAIKQRELSVFGDRFTNEQIAVSLSSEMKEVVRTGEQVAEWRRLNGLVKMYQAEWQRLLKIAKEKDSVRVAQEGYLRQLRGERVRRVESFQEVLFRDLPAADATAKTDADGQFSLRIPREGKYAIGAVGQRKIGETIERYYWLIWLPESHEKDAPLMFSNDNLLSAFPANAVIQIPK